MTRLTAIVTRLIVLAIVAPALAIACGESDTTAQAPTENDPFDRVWARTDHPVAIGDVSRTWIWGPEPRSEDLGEIYLDSAGGQRRVRYYDKARMEINDPAADPSATWYVTNGLLVVEMITGRLQLGDDVFRDVEPARVNVAGDLDDPNGVTFAALADLLNAEPRDSGEMIDERLDSDGSIATDEALAGYDVVAEELVAETNHRVAAPFWDFLQTSGPIWNGEEIVNDALFESPFFATGLPITEAYWVNALVAGEQRHVLVQCFERRCLTYTPGNPEGFEIEAGNVGLQYFQWRYEEIGFGLPTPYPDALDALPTVTFGDDGARMDVEVVSEGASTSCGLMHRRSMPEDFGMLFIFNRDRSGGFWNCNTFIPLTLAWINADGRIVALTDMDAASPGEPQNPQTYTPGTSYRYVIEANQGWFARNGVEVGDTVDLSDALAAGQTVDRPICDLLGTECGE